MKTIRNAQNKLLLLPTLLLVFGAQLACAQLADVPGMINYQGRLSDNLGSPVPSGYYEVQFRIWSHPTRSEVGDFKWGRSLALHVVTNGIFNVLLSDDGGTIGGSTTKLLDAFSGPDRYLGLTITKALGQNITSPAEISPRQQLVSAPYAIHSYSSARAVDASFATNAHYAVEAGNALTLGNLGTNAYLKTSQSSQTLTGDLRINGRLGIGTTPISKLDIQSGATSTGGNDQFAISLGYYTGGYRHFIRSRHHAGGPVAGNAIDFFLNTGTGAQDSSQPGTSNLLTLTLNNGRVGIQQASPDRPLAIKADSVNQWMSLQNSSGATKWHLNHLNNGLNLAETSVSDGRLFIEPGGNVGIGTTTPQAKLHVAGTAKVTGQVDLGSTVKVAGSSPIEIRRYPLASISNSDKDFFRTLVTTYHTNSWSAAVAGYRYNANINASSKGHYIARMIRTTSEYWTVEFAVYHETADVTGIEIDVMFIRKELVNDFR
jgi:hypothetical protein